MAGPTTKGLHGTGGRFLASSQVAGLQSDLTLDSDAFMASLVAALRALEVKSEAGLWTLGLRVQNNARLLCPVDTGRLRSSIIASKGTDSRGVFVDIGTNVEYAIYVEFGTIHMAAQPYLRPALAAAVSMIPSAMANPGAAG